MITTSFHDGSIAFADSVKNKGTATNVKFNQDFHPEEWTSKDKPNVLKIEFGYMEQFRLWSLNYNKKLFNKKSFS